MFSICNAIVLQPLPYPDSHGLVAVYDTQPALKTASASFPKYHDWKERNRVFAAIGGSTQASFVLTGTGEPDLVLGMATTASFLDVLRVPYRLHRGRSKRLYFVDDLRAYAQGLKPQSGRKESS
jgi:hypothetical protein